MTDIRRRRARARLARAFTAAARRLDPPRDPYGEWDPKAGQLIIKVPDGAGHAVPLANVTIKASDLGERGRTR